MVEVAHTRVDHTFEHALEAHKQKEVAQKYIQESQNEFEKNEPSTLTNEIAQGEEALSLFNSKVDQALKKIEDARFEGATKEGATKEVKLKEDFKEHLQSPKALKAELKAQKAAIEEQIGTSGKIFVETNCSEDFASKLKKHGAAEAFNTDLFKEAINWSEIQEHDLGPVAFKAEDSLSEGGLAFELERQIETYNEVRASILDIDSNGSLAALQKEIARAKDQSEKNLVEQFNGALGIEAGTYKYLPSSIIENLDETLGAASSQGVLKAAAKDSKKELQKALQLETAEAYVRIRLFHKYARYLNDFSDLDETAFKKKLIEYAKALKLEELVPEFIELIEQGDVNDVHDVICDLIKNEAFITREQKEVLDLIVNELVFQLHDEKIITEEVKEVKKDFIHSLGFKKNQAVQYINQDGNAKEKDKSLEESSFKVHQDAEEKLNAVIEEAIKKVAPPDLKLITEVEVFKTALHVENLKKSFSETEAFLNSVEDGTLFTEIDNASQKLRALKEAFKNKKLEIEEKLTALTGNTFDEKADPIAKQLKLLLDNINKNRKQIAELEAQKNAIAFIADDGIGQSEHLDVQGATDLFVDLLSQDENLLIVQEDIELELALKRSIVDQKQEALEEAQALLSAEQINHENFKQSRGVDRVQESRTLDEAQKNLQKIGDELSEAKENYLQAQSLLKTLKEQSTETLQNEWEVVEVDPNLDLRAPPKKSLQRAKLEKLKQSASEQVENAAAAKRAGAIAEQIQKVKTLKAQVSSLEDDWKRTNQIVKLLSKAARKEESEGIRQNIVSQEQTVSQASVDVQQKESELAQAKVEHQEVVVLLEQLEAQKREIAQEVAKIYRAHHDFSETLSALKEKAQKGSIEGSEALKAFDQQVEAATSSINKSFGLTLLGEFKQAKAEVVAAQIIRNAKQLGAVAEANKKLADLEVQYRSSLESTKKTEEKTKTLVGVYEEFSERRRVEQEKEIERYTQKIHSQKASLESSRKELLTTEGQLRAVESDLKNPDEKVRLQAIEQRAGLESQIDQIQESIDDCNAQIVHLEGKRADKQKQLAARNARAHQEQANAYQQAKEEVQEFARQRVGLLNQAVKTQELKNLQEKEVEQLQSAIGLAEVEGFDQLSSQTTTQLVNLNLDALKTVNPSLLQWQARAKERAELHQKFEVSQEEVAKIGKSLNLVEIKAEEAFRKLEETKEHLQDLKDELQKWETVISLYEGLKQEVTQLEEKLVSGGLEGGIDRFTKLHRDFQVYEDALEQLETRALPEELDREEVLEAFRNQHQDLLEHEDLYRTHKEQFEKIGKEVQKYLNEDFATFGSDLYLGTEKFVKTEDVLEALQESKDLLVSETKSLLQKIQEQAENKIALDEALNALYGEKIRLEEEQEQAEIALEKVREKLKVLDVSLEDEEELFVGALETAPEEVPNTSTSSWSFNPFSWLKR